MAPDESFTTSTRAVAPLIGFILLFGLFTVAFAGYQATSVPQQNAETEFQHYEAVQNDLIVVRNSILRAGDQDQAQFESVRLGTAYRERILALNPPNPAGTLRTSDAYDITIDEVGGGGNRVVPTRFLAYRNGYNELDTGPIYYENSVVYLDERDDGGGVAVIQDQDLVVDGTVRVSALQNEYQRSAVGRVSVELYPVEGADDFSGFSEGATVAIDLPTRLNGPEYWDDELGDFGGYEPDPDDENPGEGIDEDAYGDGIHRLNIEVDLDKLRFNTVGIDEAPEGTNTAKNVVSSDSINRGVDPSFDSLSAEVTDYQNGQDAIREINIAGTVEDVDSNGFINIAFTGDINNIEGDTTRQIQMIASFDQDFNTGSGNNGPSEVGVNIQLLDENGDPYVTCTSNTDLTDGSSELTLVDFTCD